MRLLTLAMIALSIVLPQESALGEQSAGPGHISNNVHPGDPVQEVAVAGFDSQEEALRFVQGGFATKDVKLRFKTLLSRGDSVGFEGASHLVFYYFDDERRPVLLSITRCHADLHLVIGSCGYQFLLGVKLGPAPAEKPPPREYPER